MIISSSKAGRVVKTISLSSSIYDLRLLIDDAIEQRSAMRAGRIQQVSHAPICHHADDPQFLRELPRRQSGWRRIASPEILLTASASHWRTDRVASRGLRDVPVPRLVRVPARSTHGCVSLYIAQV
jgi:hypothetical protein